MERVYRYHPLLVTLHWLLAILMTRIQPRPIQHGPYSEMC